MGADLQSESRFGQPAGVTVEASAHAGPALVTDPAADPAAALAEGLERIGLALSAQQQTRLLDYLRLLQKWNKVYNLTAVREPGQMLVRHVLDSLAALPPVRARMAGLQQTLAGLRGGRRPSVADVGTGGGLPGIPWAIACPEWNLTLIDTVQKKTAFLIQVKAALQLENVTVHAGRVESLQVAGDGYDMVTSRAFAELADMVALAGHLLAAGGVMAALKAREPQAEIGRLPAGWDAQGVEALAVPGLDEERNLVWVGRAA
ncbi:MAG: 16S rRNA (guanine(527)-N(7))-methyltransferase RsmG [Candidatus Protistobacter heckmanni]|nr:16S rRNA (guanine(527)-N(7))-methyltransferase RsmG [Candidatus Protistobacter heckmanni]